MSFYSGLRRSTRRLAQYEEEKCSHFLIPASCDDSDIEVEDDALDDVFDDDTLDPDFLLNLPDDLTPTASGKQ